MQTGSSETIIGWKSGQTTYVPLWDRMEGACLWTLLLCQNEIGKDRFLALAQKEPTAFFTTASGKIVVGYHCSAGILEQSIGARNRVGIELSYRPA